MAALMKNLIGWSAIVVGMIVPSLAHAQNARNAVYLELGGSAVVPSVNYERRISDTAYGRLGLSVVGGKTDTQSDTTWVVPLTGSWVSRPAANHHLELGGGITVAFGDRQDLYDFGGEDNFSTVVATGIVGYRYQKPHGGFQFRTALTPVLGSGVAAAWAGVSFGYAW